MCREALNSFKDSINLPTIPQNFNKKEWEVTANTSVITNHNRRKQISNPEKLLVKEITSSSYNDSFWQSVNFPKEDTSFGNVVWFRKKITIPKMAINKPLHLSLGYLIRQSHIYFNDTELEYCQ